MSEYTKKPQKSGSETKQALQQRIKQIKRKNVVPKVILRAIALNLTHILKSLVILHNLRLKNMF